MWQSVLFFVTFGICGTLVMINLFIAVILDTYVDNVEMEQRVEKLSVIHEWIDAWKEQERQGSNNKHKKKSKLRGKLYAKDFVATLNKSPVLVGLMLEALKLRLSPEEQEAELQMTGSGHLDPYELQRRSSHALGGRMQFVGPANRKGDSKVEVTDDHINAIMLSRRLRILCRLHHRGSIEEYHVVYYTDALFAIASLLVGPEFRLLSINDEKEMHISDWWHSEKGARITQEEEP